MSNEVTGAHGRHRCIYQFSLGAPLGLFFWHVDPLWKLKQPPGAVTTAGASSPQPSAAAWTIEPGEGSGPIRFGMSTELVAGLLGEPSVRKSSTTGEVLVYANDGLVVTANKSFGVWAINCVDQMLVPVYWCQSMSSCTGRTERGIGVGSAKKEEVIADRVAAHSDVFSLIMDNPHYQVYHVDQKLLSGKLKSP